jgi:hypothetical protein
LFWSPPASARRGPLFEGGAEEDKACARGHPPLIVKIRINYIKWYLHFMHAIFFCWLCGSHETATHLLVPMDSSYNHYQFVLAESTGGRWGKVCDDFFRKQVSRKTNSKDNQSVHRAYSNYWLSRLSLSCCLQNSIAALIVNKSKLINGDMVLHNPNYQFDEDFILESGFRH